MDSSPVKTVCLAALCSMLLCHCGSIGSTVAVEGELSTPATSLPRYEYPFDASGRYREDWVSPPVKPSSSPRGRNTTSSVRPEMVKPKVSPNLEPLATPPPARPAAPTMVSHVPEPPRRSMHRVANGETLWSISRRYGITVAALKESNGITADTILSGDTIVIP